MGNLDPHRPLSAAPRDDAGTSGTFPRPTPPEQDEGHPLLELTPLRLRRAEEVMSRRLVTIDGTQSVAVAVRRMRDERVSSLIIERRDPQDAWGIVTRADIVHKIITPGREPDAVRVYEIMTKPIITISPGLLLKFALRLMEQAHVRRAVVFDGHKLVGILTHNDILGALKV